MAIGQNLGTPQERGKPNAINHKQSHPPTITRESFYIIPVIQGIPIFPVYPKKKNTLGDGLWHLWLWVCHATPK